MGTISKFTVLFEPPFWVGIFERQQGNHYEACKIIFGAEPKEGEIYEFFLHHWGSLRFSPAIQTEAVKQQSHNPKRLQRQIQKQLRQTGVGTKAQQAFKQMQEQGKQERCIRNRQRKQEQKELVFQQKQQKRKEKHKGH
ncbi:YjdF family protein [Massilioclostridium coli]|uniref:YjdF family protein n=1 Tax=Massilioclostridium coli TaxID=1870991 RepID=UPI00085CA600|nr:YjdF family protein [Massilioclostridium coli]